MCVVNNIPWLLGRPQGRSVRMRKISPTQGLDLRTVKAVEGCVTMIFQSQFENGCFMQIIIS